MSTIEKLTVIDLVDVSRKVDRAVELNRLIGEQLKDLNTLKNEIRDIAKTGAFPKTETGAVLIRSHITNYCAQVTYPKATPAIIKGVDTEPVINQLSIDTFNLLFRRVVIIQPVEKFEQAFTTLPKSIQGRLREIIVWVPNTPQVRLST